MSRKLSLVGTRFGRLVVTEEVGRDKHQEVLWRCVCDCGNEKIVVGSLLTSGKTRSCGCLFRDVITERNSTHGMSKTRLYHRWASMIERCNDKNDARYGGRGISVCDEWKRFEPFRDWALANGYNDTLSLDRINVNGNYCPENCRWATTVEQANNTRNNRFITAFGETMTIAQASRKYNIKAATIVARIEKYGFSVEDALTKRPKREANANANS